MPLIQSIEINPVSFPVEKPFSNHVRRITALNGLVVRIFTDSNIIGQSIIYGLNNLPYSEVVQHISEDLIPKLMEGNIDDVESLHIYWCKLWHEYKQNNYVQEKLYALAAIDIAIWDIYTKTNNISLHKYFGGSQSKIPAIGTTGWLSLSIEELISECKSYATKGIKAFKVRIGHDDDLLRIKTLREVMGDDFILMLDANQRYSVEQATAIASALSHYNILWIEEPTDNSLGSIEKINKSCCIPIALGENIIAKNDFKTICEKKLTKYLQPDLPRCGGITGFMQVMQLASKYNLPVCNHLMYELSAGLIAALPNGYMLEYDNLVSPSVFTQDFSVKEGYLYPPSAPGTGVEITDQALKQFSLNSYVFNNAVKIRKAI